jgi:hypothetical protein
MSIQKVIESVETFVPRSATTMLRYTRFVKPACLWIGVCLLLATAAIAGAHVGGMLRPTHRSAMRPSPRLIVPPSSLSIGDVWETSAYEMTLPIHNTSGHELEINGFATSCDCTKITPSRLLIPAHEMRHIHLVLDLTSRIPEDRNQANGKKAEANSRDVTISLLPKVTALAPEHIEEWAITARVRSALRLSSSEISFESRSRLAQPWGSRAITVTDLVGVEQLTVTSTSPNFLVTIERASMEGRDHIIRVRPSVPLPIGHLRAQVRIASRLTSGKELPAQEVPVFGEVLPDVCAAPHTLAFGVQPVGAVAQETFTLLSRSGSAFYVQSVQASEGGVSVTKQADAGPRAEYLVQQKVSKTGDQVTLEPVIDFEGPIA